MHDGMVVHVASLCAAIRQTNWCCGTCSTLHKTSHIKHAETWLAANEFHDSDLALEGELFVTQGTDEQPLQFR